MNGGCYYCGKMYGFNPQICRYCGQNFCNEHLNPEEHKCEGWKKLKGKDLDEEDILD